MPGTHGAEEAAPVNVPALALHGVNCSFADANRPGAAYTAIRDLDLVVGAGEFVSVVGPTGCGKSTLLNVAAGLIVPSAGRVEVFGVPLAGLNRRAGYLFQADGLMPWRTALGNVMAGLEFHGRVDARPLAEHGLKRVGLGGFGDRYPHQLSGGMKKRVALAQTLVLDPDIILMDEPFSALDVQTRQLMENEVLDLWLDGAPWAGQARPAPRGGSGRPAEPDLPKKKAVLFITHDLDEAIAMSDRVVCLGAGPGSRPIGEFAIDLPRPRDVTEVRTDPRFVALHQSIWEVLREQVLVGYRQQLGGAVGASR